MKKVFVLVMVAIMTLGMSFKAQAIENPWNTGTIVANAHVGFFPGIGGSVSGDYVLVNSWWKGHFTVGGYANAMFHNVTASAYGVSSTSHRNSFSILPRASYGLNITNDFEVHAGVMTGICFINTYTTTNLTTNPFDKVKTYGFEYGTFVGCRYFFTPNFGVSAEACYSSYYVPYLNAGITLKF